MAGIEDEKTRGKSERDLRDIGPSYIGEELPVPSPLAFRGGRLAP